MFSFKIKWLFNFLTFEVFRINRLKNSEENNGQKNSCSRNQPQGDNTVVGFFLLIGIQDFSFFTTVLNPVCKIKGQGSDDK